MSKTAQDVIDAVRLDIKDEDDGKPVIATDTIRRVLDRKVMEVADALVLQPSWVTGAISLSVGQDEYDLTDTQEYGEVIQLRYASTALGTPGLVKMSRGMMDDLRDVDHIPHQRPRYYTLEMRPDQTIHVTFDAEPVSAEVVDALVSVYPAEWTGTDDAPPTLYFSRRALRALELLVAASVGMTMNDEQLNQLQLNPAAFAVWERDAREMLRKEKLSVSRLRLDHGPTSQEWVTAWRNT